MLTLYNCLYCLVLALCVGVCLDFTLPLNTAAPNLAWIISVGNQKLTSVWLSSPAPILMNTYSLQKNIICYTSVFSF